jgi:hypothetical protein
MEIQILYEAALWYEDKNECSMAFWIQVLGNPSLTYIFSITCYSLYHKDHWSFDCAIMNLRWVQLWNRTHVFVCLHLHLLRKELIINRESWNGKNGINHCNM